MSVLACFCLLAINNFSVGLAQELDSDLPAVETVKPAAEPIEPAVDAPKPNSQVLENLTSVSIDNLERLFTLYSRTENTKAADQVLAEIKKRDPAKAADLRRYLFLSGPIAPKIEEIYKMRESRRIVEALEAMKAEHFLNEPFPLDVDLAESYTSIGKFEKAIEIYNRVIANPTIYGAEEKLRAEELLKFIDRDKLIFQGYEHLRNRDLAKAKEVVVELADEYPDDKKVSVYRTDVLLSEEIVWIYEQIRLGNFDVALSRAELLSDEHLGNNTARRLVSDVNLAIEVEKIYGLLTSQKFKQALVEANLLAVQLPDAPIVQTLLADAKRTNRFAEVYTYLANPSKANLNLAFAKARELDLQFPGDPDVKQLFADIAKTKREGMAYRYANDPSNRRYVEDSTPATVYAAPASDLAHSGGDDDTEEHCETGECEESCEPCETDHCEVGSACATGGFYFDQCDGRPFWGTLFSFQDGLEGSIFSLDTEAYFFRDSGMALGIHLDSDFINLSERRITSVRDRELLSGYAFARIDHNSRVYSETRLGINRNADITGGASIGIRDSADRNFCNKLYFDVNSDLQNESYESIQLIAMRGTQHRLGLEGSIDLPGDFQFRYDVFGRTVYADGIKLGSGQRFVGEIEKVIWENYDNRNKFAASLFTNIARFSGETLSAGELNSLGITSQSFNLGEQFYDPEVSRVGPMLSATFDISPNWILNAKVGQLYDFADDSDVTRVSIHNEWTIDENTFLRGGIDYRSNGEGPNRGDDVYSGFLYFGRKF